MPPIPEFLNEPRYLLVDKQLIRLEASVLSWSVLKMMF